MPSWLSGLIQGVAENEVAKGVNWMVGVFKDFFLNILGQTIIPLLNNVMSYQNFFSTGVNSGWDIVRNFSNLFFALILLIIAIATVLNVGALDNYTAKRMLPQFIFVALFINFSKAIVGLLIDISQIIMVSFYNSFGPSMTDVIGNASKIAEAGATSNIEPLILNIFTIVVIAFLTFVLLWTALILAMRIVTLWFVIMLSPLAFMATLVPGLKSINSEWTKYLQESLITGPTLMFLLYLAFAVMSQGISANTTTVGGDNLMNNGNLINYVLVIGLLFLANTTATKAGQAAPPMLKQAVGVAGTVATFGLGAYVGAGGYNTNQLRKKTIELGDKGIGGVTNITGQNARYEAAKKDLQTQQATSTGIFGKNTPLKKFNPLSYTQGFTAEGKKEQLEDFEKQKAIKLFNEGKLEKEENKRYQKIAATLQAAASTEVKDEFNVEKLGGDLEKALQEGDKFTAMALSTRISELKGWSQIFAPGSKFAKYSEENEQESAQLDAFINDNFERKDANGKVIGDKMTNSFRSRQVNILNDKGAGNWATGLAERDVKNPNYSPIKKASKAGIVGAGDILAKNNDVFNSRVKTKDGQFVTENGKVKYAFDIAKFAPVIENETSIKELKKSKNWNKYAPIKKDIANAIRNYLDLLSTNPTEADKEYPSLSVITIEKLEAALKGLTK